MPLINDPDGLSQGGETTVTDAVFQNSAGSSTEIASGGAELPAVTSGDYIEVRDADTAANNGLYIVTGAPTTSLIALTKQALDGTVVDPQNSGSETLRILGTDADEKNIFIDTGLRLFSFLNGFGSTTVLDNDGVVGQALYSFLKEEWKDDNDLIKFPFPMTAITPEQFEFNGWRPVDEGESTISTGDASNTRELIRTAGWDEIDTDGVTTDGYFGFITLGNIDSGDRAYYFYESQSSATSTVFDGPANEAVRVITGTGRDTTGYDFTTNSITRNDAGSFITDGYLVDDQVLVQDAALSANRGIRATITAVTAGTLTVSGTPFTADTGDTSAFLAIDRRSLSFTTRIRVFGKTYDESTTSAIGVTQLNNGVFRFPLSEAIDNVINDLVTTTVSDLFDDIITTPVAPYDDMTIAYFATAQDRSGFNALGGDTPSPGDAQFGVIIDGDVSVSQEDGGGAATAEEIYAFVQAKLEGSVDINDGAGAAAVTVPGQLAEELLVLASTGNTLSSLSQTTNPGGDGTGVYVDSFSSDDTNRVAFRDNDDDSRTFPFVASATITFNQNLSTDVDAVYRVFFTNDDAGDDLGRDFGTIDAITVDDNAGTDVAGAVPQVPGGSSVGFSYDYDGNVQRGAGSSGTDAPITLVAIGLSTGQYVLATGTLARATGQVFSLVAGLERNFNNP